MEQLYEAIRRARLELGMTQDDLALLAKIQRRQISILENGGNITLNTLRRVVDVLPNLQVFTFPKLRMRPEYFKQPPFEWEKFNFVMFTVLQMVHELAKAFDRFVEPDGVTKKTQRVTSLKELAERERAARRAQPPRKKGQEG